jgi:predicted glycosyltransferase
LIYSQDGLGLGHLRRNINIAHEVHHLDPAVIMLFIADSPMAPFFTVPPKSRFVKLPTVVKVGEGIWRACRKILTASDGIWEERSRIIRHTLRDFRPDIVLVDHLPQGPNGELAGVLRDLRRQCRSTKIILGQRDILGLPEVIVQQWRSDKTYDAIAEYYDAVLVYGCQDVYKFTTEYQFPAALASKVRYCGYVCPPTTDDAPDRSPSARFRGPQPFTVLATGGGGGDARPMMAAVLDAIRLLGASVPFNTCLVTGPFMSRADQRALSRKTMGLPVIVDHIRSDIADDLHHVDLVVSMAGYNTITEILRYRKKAVVVPRTGPSAEQRIRSRIWRERGLVKVIEPADLTPRRLAAALVDRLYEPDGLPTRHLPDLGGATHAASLLLDARPNRP